jgi:hypothetical protein
MFDRSYPMSVTDSIQLIVATIYGVTLIAILLQLRSQNRIFMAQILKDSFDMYWKTLDPVPDEALTQLECYPDDYMDKGTYEEKYKANREAIRKYIFMVHVYEFLAFSYYGVKRHRLPDPFQGYGWIEMWTRDLLKEREFLDVHEYQKRFYPHFAVFVDGLLSVPTVRT